MPLGVLAAFGLLFGSPDGLLGQPVGRLLESDLVFGGADGPALLTSVSDVAVGAGYVFVTQPRDAVVKRFKTDGTYLGPIGRRGDGPGEFQMPTRVGWRADSLWVYDFRHGRVSLFSSEGEFLDSYPSVYDPERFPFLATGPAAVLPGREMVVRPVFPDHAASQAPDTVSVLVTTSEGTDPAALVTLSVAHSIASVPVEVDGRTRAAVIPEPFSDDPLWAVSADGGLLAVVNREAADASAELGLLLVRPATRDTVAHVSVPRSAEPFTRERLQAYVESRMEGAAAQLSESEASEFRRALEREIHQPEYLPLAESVFVDGRHRTWVESTGSENGGNTGIGEDGENGVSTWEVFDARGGALGKVRVPADVQLLEAAAGFAWGLSTDDFDVPLIHRFPLPGDLAASPSVPAPAPDPS